MIPINSFNDPSIGSIEGLQNAKFLKKIGIAFLIAALALSMYMLFFYKKEMPKEKGDDKK
jgi:hypothetical protein